MDERLVPVPLDAFTLKRFGKNDPAKLKAYLSMLAAFLGGKPENTRRTYVCGIKQFFGLFEWISPEDVTVAHAVAFKRYLLEKKAVSESTTYYRLSALASFFDFLCMPAGATEKPLITSNPFHLVARNDIKPSPYARATAMEWETFKAIVDAIPADEVGLRDKAVLLFFAFTGRRRAEVANLRIRDLHLSRRPRSYTVRVKNGHIKTFELPDIVFDAIRAYWVAADRLVDLDPDAGVFTATTDLPPGVTDIDAPLSDRMMNVILDRAARRAGIKADGAEGVRIHAIRHMAARDLDRAGLRLQDIQDFLGHASPNTTQLYLNRLSGPSKAHEEVLVKIRDATKELAQGVVDTDA